MIARAAAAAAVLLSLAAAPAHADRVVSSSAGGREGVGVTDNRLVGWTLLRRGTVLAVFTDSRRPVKVRCTAGRPGRTVTLRATIEDGQLPAFLSTRGAGALVDNVHCTARR